jgi:hypothetical protein
MLNFWCGKLADFHRRFKANTLDVFHNEIGVIVLIYASVHHMNNVGMVNSGNDKRSIFKSIECFYVAIKSLKSNLMATGRCKES